MSTPSPSPEAARDAEALTVADGKYTFRLHANGCDVEVLRYSEPWLVIDKGSNAIMALVREAIERDAHAAEGQRRVEALERVLREADNALDCIWAAVWDNLYGKGLHPSYAQAVDRDVKAARQTIAACLAATGPTRAGEGG